MNMNKPVKNSSGFTLVELMLTLIISSVIIAAIYTAYLAQQRVYLAQEQVAEMQQNIRASMWMINSEIRMAGHGKGDGTNDTSCNVGATGASVAPGFLTVTPAQVDFSMDLNIKKLLIILPKCPQYAESRHIIMPILR